MGYLQRQSDADVMPHIKGSIIMANGYFQLVTGERSTKLRIVPPTEGGSPVDMKEVVLYLKQRNISYDISTLNVAADHMNADEQLIEINKITCMRERESYVSVMSQDHMSLTVRFYPESAGTPANGEKMTEPEFLNDMKQHNIKFGVQTDSISEFFAKRSYCTDLIAAKGKEPRQGQDGYVEYRFDTERTARPTLLPDGSVDFFHLNILQICGKGQLLALLHPEVHGEEGCDIQGAVISPREVNKAELSFGKNVVISDDRMSLTSAVDGHVSLVQGTVEVSDVLSIKDIGVETGNVDYEGNIEIEGNIDTGYTVSATGDINVKGVVGGATIISGGNVLIARGMNGMGKGTIKADGNVISKFLENVTVDAGGYVSSESVIQSSIDAGSEVNVDGKRGFISGGTVSAGASISAKTLGSDMGTSTIIEVGVDPDTKKEIIEVQKKVIEDKKQIETLEPVLMTYKKKMASGAQLPASQVQRVQTLAQAYLQKKKEYDKNLEKLGELQNKMKQNNDAFVAVKDTAYPGVHIVIGELSMNIKKPVQFCRFVINGGDVRTASY